MAHGMTEKQRMVFEFVAAFYDERGEAPTLPQIARACELGAGVILGHVLALIDKVSSSGPIAGRSPRLGIVREPEKISTILREIAARLNARLPCRAVRFTVRIQPTNVCAPAINAAPRPSGRPRGPL